MKTYKLITASLVGITACSGAVLASSVSFADGDSATDTTTVTIPVSCMMSGTVDAPHSAELAPGTYSGATGSVYENGIGKTTLTTYCNDYNGFSLYAIGFTGDSYDSENHTKLVGTSASGNTTISTGVYTTGDTTSSWSMKVTKVTDSTASYNPTNMSITNSFDTWHVIPNVYTQVAQYKASTGSSATDSGTNALGAKVETTYAAYIAPTQAADTYTGQVKYVMVHPYSELPLQPQPSTAGYITYYANASNAVGTMGNQGASDGASITLYPSNFSRTGYGFAGWSDAFDYATNPNAHFYGPNETITVPEGTTTNGLSLYAVWIKSQGSLQDATKVATLCGTGAGSLTEAPTDGTANLSSATALTDERDNQTYAIAKLADGNCWMIENLRLENTGQHNTDGSLAQGYNSSFIGLAASESANFSNSTTANSLYSTDGTTDATISGSNQGYQFPRYNNINTQQRATNTTNTDVNTYSDGNYYNWAATIADTADHSSGDYGATSICPAGWRIPQGNTTSAGFGKLDVEMGGTGADQYTAEASNRWRKYPANFLYSGRFYGSSATNRGSYGSYWSSTAYRFDASYRLYLNSDGVSPGTSNGIKYYGFSVRCTVAGA